MRLVRGVRDRLSSPTLHLDIMVVLQRCEEEKLTPAAFHLCLSVRHTSRTTPGSTPLRQYWSEFWRWTIFIQSSSRLTTEALWLRGQRGTWSTPTAAKPSSYMCKIKTLIMYTRHKKKTAHQWLTWLFFTCHLFLNVAGFQSHDPAHLRSHSKPHKHLPNHSGWSSDRQDR